MGGAGSSSKCQTDCPTKEDLTKKEREVIESRSKFMSMKDKIKDIEADKEITYLKVVNIEE